MPYNLKSVRVESERVWLKVVVVDSGNFSGFDSIF